MKKLFSCKLLSMLLALTLLFASAVSLKPTQKANADQYSATYNFVIEALRDLQFVNEGGHHLCIIVDKNLFVGENGSLINITTSTTIDDINDTDFMQSLATVLTNTVGAPPDEAYLNEDGLYDCTAVCASVQLDLLVYRSGFAYRNLTTNENVGLENSSHLTSRTDTTYDSIVYGFLHTAPNPRAMHILFTSIQQSNFYIKSFHALYGSSSTGAHYTIHTDLLYGV